MTIVVKPGLQKHGRVVLLEWLGWVEWVLFVIFVGWGFGSCVIRGGKCGFCGHFEWVSTGCFVVGFCMLVAEVCC